MESAYCLGYCLAFLHAEVNIFISGTTNSFEFIALNRLIEVKAIAVKISALCKADQKKGFSAVTIMF